MSSLAGAMTPEDRTRTRGHAAQILDRLRRGPVTNRELSEISLKYTGRISDLRKSGWVIAAERVEGGLFRYTLASEPATARDPDQPGFSEHTTGAQPSDPLQPGSRGQALAVAAFALEALSGVKVRLHWCVDLQRDIGDHADTPIDPSNPYRVDTHWGQFLQRFKAALDRQPWGPTRCHLAMTVRHRTQSTGRPVLTTWSIPWSANLSCLCRAAPPVGVWRLAAEPEDPKGHDRDSHPMPVSFWMDGIPF